MIISAVVNSFKTIVSKPILFIPILISILFGKVLAQATVWAWIPIADIFTMWGSSTENPFLALIISNPIEIGAILVSAIIGLTVSVIALDFLARIVNEQKFMEAVNDAVVDWKKALAIAITFSLATIVFMALGIFIVELGAINELISFILLIALYLVTFFAIIKMVFVFPAMTEEKKAKEAMQKSWRFLTDYGAFGKALAFIILVSAIIILIDLVTLTIATALLQAGITDEIIIDNIIPVLEDMVITSFAGVAIASYYFNKK